MEVGWPHLCVLVYVIPLYVFKILAKKAFWLPSGLNQGILGSGLIIQLTALLSNILYIIIPI